eukprot:51456-Prymnesium_polylepis.1
MWNGEDEWIEYASSEPVESIAYTPRGRLCVVTRPRPKFRAPSLSSLLEELVEEAGGHVMWGATEASAEARTVRLVIVKT